MNKKSFLPLFLFFCALYLSCASTCRYPYAKKLATNSYHTNSTRKSLLQKTITERDTKKKDNKTSTTNQQQTNNNQQQHHNHYETIHNYFLIFTLIFFFLSFSSLIKPQTQSKSQSWKITL